MKEIVILSGKGGTGKTSVTAALAATGPAKVLADCDVDAADLHLILAPNTHDIHAFWSGEVASIDTKACSSCGLCAAKCRFGAIDERLQGYGVNATRCEGCALCAYVCPEDAVTLSPRLCGEWYESDTRFGPMVHARLGIGQENSGRLVTVVRNRSRELAEAIDCGTILTDGPPGIGCPVIASLTNAGLALLVAEPTRSAQHDLERVLHLANHFRVPCAAIINKSTVNPAMADAIEAFFEAHSVPVLGRLGYDPAFTQAQIQGLAVTEYAPDTYLETFATMWEGLQTAMAAAPARPTLTALHP
ncbi:MAG: ATP-binding protein [Desulfovibrionaceae bacterium]